MRTRHTYQVVKLRVERLDNAIDSIDRVRSNNPRAA